MAGNDLGGFSPLLFDVVSVNPRWRRIPVADADDIHVTVVVDVTDFGAIASVGLDDELVPALTPAAIEHQLEAAMLRLGHSADEQVNPAVKVKISRLEIVAEVHNSNRVFAPGRVHSRS